MYKIHLQNITSKSLKILKILGYVVLGSLWLLTIAGMLFNFSFYQSVVDNHNIEVNYDAVGYVVIIFYLMMVLFLAQFFLETKIMFFLTQIFLKPRFAQYIWLFAWLYIGAVTSVIPDIALLNTYLD